MACRVRDMAIAANAPLGGVLEGGYQPRATAASLCATLAAFAGGGEVVTVAPQPSPEPSLTARAAAQVGRYWTL